MEDQALRNDPVNHFSEGASMQGWCVTRREHRAVPIAIGSKNRDDLSRFFRKSGKQLTYIVRVSCICLLKVS